MEQIDKIKKYSGNIVDLINQLYQIISEYDFKSKVNLIVKFTQVGARNNIDISLSTGDGLPIYKCTILPQRKAICSYEQYVDILVFNDVLDLVFSNRPIAYESDTILMSFVKSTTNNQVYIDFGSATFKDSFYSIIAAHRIGSTIDHLTYPLEDKIASHSSSISTDFSKSNERLAVELQKIKSIKLK